MESNITMTLGYKGQGKPNGLPAYVAQGIYTLGGVQNANDTAQAKFGVVVNSDPSADDGTFTVGAQTVTGVAAQFTVTVGAACTTAGNVLVDGESVAVTTAASTAAAVATLIAAHTFTRFTVSAVSAVVTFVSRAATVVSAPTYDANGTSATATVATTVAGTVGSLPRGVIIFDAGVAQNDPAKPDYVLLGAPLTIAYRGPIWISSWGTTGTGSIAPVLGAVVQASNTTGAIEFLASGTTSPSSGFSLIGATVKTISKDTNGVLLFLAM